jgi:hypothetical protein
MGDMWISFKCVDVAGTVRKASISAFALRTLFDSYLLAQGAIMEKYLPEDKQITVKFSLGETREEIYGVEGKLQ